jgi:RES domain-containing protein
LSGAGAAIRGGRFNRPGQAALYLSLDIATAVAEAAQGFASRVPPLTICEYDVECEPVVDLTSAEGIISANTDHDVLACSWSRLSLEGKPVPSWGLVDRLQQHGAVGALVPSLAPQATIGASNLVLWTWGSASPSRVSLFDPDGRLPRDQRSWSDTER